EAEEAWSEGLTLFAKSREMWIQDMSRILEEGTVLRDEGIAAARLEISRIAGDIEEAVREEEKKFASQVEAALGLYRDSLSLMDSVDDNLDYYSRQAEECRSALSRGGSSAKRGLLKKELAFYLEEYTQWRGFRENLVLQIEDARGMLRELELSVAAYNPTVGAGTLDRDIEDLRSRTDRLYREWMISEAVAAYAGENSSLRDTEAESLANLRRAEGILDKAESEYESALRGLAELKDDLVSAEGSIRSVQLRLAEAREEAQRALEEYESTLSVYSSEDMEVLERSISGLREAVESWTGGEEPGRVLIYSEYLSALEHERRLDIGYSGSVDKLKEKFAEFCSGDSENLLSELQALSGADEFLNFLTPLVQEALLPEALESLFIAYGAVRFTEASEYGQDAGDSLAAVEAVLDKAALLESEDDLSAWMTGDEVLMIAREAGWQDLSEVTPEQMLIRLEEYRYSLDREYTRTLLSERMETVRGTGSLFGDADFLEYSLYTALSLVFSGTPDLPAGSSDELYEVYLENVNLINGYQEKIEALEAGMALCIEGRDLYKEDILDPKLQVYLKKKKAVEELLLTYRTAASQFDGLQAEYIAAQQELDTLYSACQNAAYVRQEALEILDNASGVYSPGEMSIYTVLEERREKYSNSLEALNILEDLAAGGRGKDDETLALLIREKGDLLSALNIIVYTEQQLSEELVQLRNDRSSAENTMQAECESLIDFSFRDGLRYSYDQSYLEQGMSSFSSWNNGSLAGSINNYFSQSDSSEIFTRDLLLWFEGISSYGSTADLLKTFSFTYYHELREMEGMSWDKIRSTYTVDLFNDPRHQDLLDTDGTLFTSVRIGYEGVVDRYLRGEYETVEKTYYSLVDQGISKVFISGEEWLAEACGLFSIRKRKDPKFKNLYAFYKMLMYSDAMATSEMRTAMEKDLSRVAWKYIDSQAKTQQDKFKRLLFKGYRKKGRDIKDKRETLAETASAYNGISKRSKLSRSAAAASSALEKLDWIEKRETTLGSGTLETADQFFSLLTSLGNVDISGDPGDCITSAFEDLSDDQRSSPAAVLEAVKTVLETGFVSNNRSITERRTELAREKSALAASMESLLHGNNWDNDAFTQAA
ncbi:MAG: hypothetical protein PQJ50_11670, partial [Spirochaetales bacterium]|nr:hypothetical protein [Spirochaetales bacterium]